MNNLSALQAQYVKLGEEITKLKAKEDNVWPKCGVRYWCVDALGIVRNPIWGNDSSGSDRMMQSIGNIYRTQSDANKQIEALKVIAELRACEGRKSFVVGEDNYCLSVNMRSGVIETDINTVYDGGWQSIYFKSRVAAKNAINKVGADRILDASTWLAMGK